jgi:hypothetical protein
VVSRVVKLVILGISCGKDGISHFSARKPNDIKKNEVDEVEKSKRKHKKKIKNLLDEKGVQNNYLDMTEMPNKTMTYLRLYCNGFPILLNYGFPNSIFT